MNLVQTFSVALPEFILVAVALSLVLVAAFANSSESEASTLKLVRSLSLGGYGLAFLSLFMLPAGQMVLFNGLFATDGFAIYMKGLVLLGAGRWPLYLPIPKLLGRADCIIIRLDGNESQEDRIDACFESSAAEST